MHKNLAFTCLETDPKKVLDKYKFVELISKLKRVFIYFFFFENVKTTFNNVKYFFQNLLKILENQLLKYGRK